VNEKVRAALSQEHPTPLHKQMLAECKELVGVSRRKMTERYTDWDLADEVYRGEISPDSDDKEAQERGQPTKMIVPMTYSQVQTFVAFCFSLYTQRERVFELVGMSEKDHRPAKIGEALLARDLAYNNFELRLYQFLVDIARYGLGIFKVTWVRETQMVRRSVSEEPPKLFGITLGIAKEFERLERVTKYLGNKIHNISPYAFFPDTRLPIGQFQEGEFVASDSLTSMQELKRMEVDGEVAGVKWVKKFIRELDTDGTTSIRRIAPDATDLLAVPAAAQTAPPVVLTEVQRVIVPSEYEVDGEPLGEEDYPIKYVIWYVNDQRIVKLEPLGYIHDRFTYEVGEYNPDSIRLHNQGLSDTITQLQSAISWFINSRIESVRRVIENRYVVDPTGIELEDMKAHLPVIRLKPGATGQGVIDRWIKQLEVQDVTASHISDAKFLHDIVQVTTGISEALLGQFHSGRRSATEARNVGSGSAARLRMVASLLYRTALEPVARQMLSNLRDGLDGETYVRLLGIPRDLKATGDFVKADRKDLVGAYEFELFDGTLPSERFYTAQVLEALLQGLMSKPEAALVLGIDPKAVLLEALELRGVRNPERFLLPYPPQAMPVGGGPAEGMGEPPQPFIKTPNANERLELPQIPGQG